MKIFFDKAPSPYYLPPSPTLRHRHKRRRRITVEPNHVIIVHPHTHTHKTHTNPNTHIRIFYKRQTSDFIHHHYYIMYIIINGVFRPPLRCHIITATGSCLGSSSVLVSCHCRQRRFASPRRNARFTACYVRCSLFGSFGDSLIYTSSFSRSVYE